MSDTITPESCNAFLKLFALLSANPWLSYLSPPAEDAPPCNATLPAFELTIIALAFLNSVLFVLILSLPNLNKLLPNSIVLFSNVISCLSPLAFVSPPPKASLTFPSIPISLSACSASWSAANSASIALCIDFVSELLMVSPKRLRISFS